MTTQASVRRGQGLAERAGAAVAGLNPGYFALVMGTGIVSVGLSAQGWSTASGLLLATAVVAYAVLIGLFCWRLAAFPARMLADFRDPAKAFAFFTFVAGSGVLGTRLLADGHRTPATALLVVALVAWLFLGYAVPWAMTLGGAARPVLAKANGTWFIWTVGSQAVAVLAASLEPVVTTGRRELAIVAVFSWSVGAALYVAAGVFVAIRLLAYEVRPVDLGQPYWVSMGATAITVLAGARIVEMADAPMVDATRGLVGGLAVLFWAFGTWLIPVLVAVGVWRHLIRHVPLTYEAPMWSMVFPLGMYGVASINLGVADGLPAVAAIGRAEIWVAFAVWAAVFCGMLLNLGRTLGRPAPLSAAAG